MNENNDFERVLQFWFGDLDEQGLADGHHQQRWFNKDTAFDDEIRHRFATDHQIAVSGGHTDWRTTARGELAYVIVVDQFSRNMFRGDPRSWAWDSIALSAAKRALDKGWERSLRVHERTFLYMPLMHSEVLADQERCVQLFSTFAQQLQGEAAATLGNGVHFAIAHRDIIARFGRFPHRNAILGRRTTAEEEHFLTQPNSSF